MQIQQSDAAKDFLERLRRYLEEHTSLDDQDRKRIAEGKSRILNRLKQLRSPLRDRKEAREYTQTREQRLRQRLYKMFLGDK